MERSIFEDSQLLDDLIVGYCEIFGSVRYVDDGAGCVEGVSWDYDPGDDFTNDSYYNEMEV
jgi:hypothetical protein